MFKLVLFTKIMIFNLLKESFFVPHIPLYGAWRFHDWAFAVCVIRLFQMSFTYLWVILILWSMNVGFCMPLVLTKTISTDLAQVI